MNVPECVFCAGDGGTVLYRDGFLRVVWADEPDYPGFCRVIVGAHVRETTDLAPADRRRLMDAVFAVEEAVRAETGAFKMNVASLGNVTPHLHWHVIPRRADDARFPDPVWGPPKRSVPAPPLKPGAVERLRAALLPLGSGSGRP
jgi:diadenosine tetraphosphate (Ap4A) HIT family hydrolase